MNNSIVKYQVTGVFLIKNNKILYLVRNKKNDQFHRQGMYIQMGGKVEQGESLEACAIREVKEESGITVHSVELKGIAYGRQFGPNKNDLIFFVYTSDNFSGEPVDGNEGNFEWVHIKDMFNVKTYDADKVYYPFLLENRFFVIEYEFDGFAMKNYKILYLADKKI